MKADNTVNLSLIKECLYTSEYQQPILKNSFENISDQEFIQRIIPQSLLEAKAERYDLGKVWGISAKKSYFSKFMNNSYIPEVFKSALVNILSIDSKLIKDIEKNISREWKELKGDIVLLRSFIIDIDFKISLIGEDWSKYLKSNNTRPEIIITFLVLFSILRGRVTVIYSAPLEPQISGESKLNGMKKRDYATETNLWNLADETFAYIPILASWEKNSNEFVAGDIHFSLSNQRYKIPDIFKKYQEHLGERNLENYLRMDYEKKIRIDSFEIENYGNSKQLYFVYSPIVYSDFLLTNGILDQDIPGDSITYREYINCEDNIYTTPLADICGVGLFIITADKKILVAKTSTAVCVNPGVFSYTSGGTIDYSECVNPFNDIIRETYEELNYDLAIDDVKLFSFGQDYKMKYYQFSFYAEVAETANEILRNVSMARDFFAEMQKVEVIDFNLESIVHHIKENKWSDDAVATLLTLCSKFFGKQELENFLNPEYILSKYRSKMRYNWENRAKRKGVAAVLSTRFPSVDLKKISENYLSYVLNYIGDLEGKSILEIGGGIGVFTKEYALSAKSVTMVDLSMSMIERNKEYLGKDIRKKVTYINSFIQDIKVTSKFDIAVSSLVLTHNEVKETKKIINKLKSLSDTIYLFEPIDNSMQASNHSYAHTRELYIKCFEGYNIEKEDYYILCVDKLWCAKFVREKI